MGANPDLSAALSWQPPTDWRRIVTLDAHTGGEPLRIYLAGMPQPAGSTQLQRRQDCQQRWDALRRSTLWEPRGHADMYGCLVTPPEREDSDFGLLFSHNEGYSSMCGHAIIATVTALVQTGALSLAVVQRDGLAIDTPAGQVRAGIDVEQGALRSVSFRNVPAFVQALDAVIDVPGVGSVQLDLAYGGAFYVVVDAAQLDVALGPQDLNRLIALGRSIKQAAAAAIPPLHPESAALSFLYGTIFTGAPGNAENHTRNVCVFADGEVDRSPTGTGVSARMAIAHARGDVAEGEWRRFESVVDSVFSARVVQQLQWAGGPAVVPELRGSAHITGRHEFFLDPDDKLGAGFLLR